MSDLSVHLFKKLDGEAQRGYMFDSTSGAKMEDCEMVYAENENVLPEGTYTFDDFKRVVIAAKVVNWDEQIPAIESSDVILLQLKKTK